MPRGDRAQPAAHPHSSVYRSRWTDRLSLRRIVTSNRLIPEVDGFRFLAIFIVVIAHIYVQCAPPVSAGVAGRLFFRAFNDGRHGVYLFFTISGFILALPFARHHLEDAKPVALRSYFRRRLTRLEPPYVLAMLLRTPALLLYKQTALAVLGIHLLASLLYVHNVAFGQYSTINPPAWSLEIEIQFYLLAPLLTLVFAVRSAALRRTVLLAAILLSGLAATRFIDPYGRLSLSLANYFQYFAAGFLLCDFYLTGTRFSLPPLAWDVVGAAALLWILFSQDPWYPVALPLVTLCLYMAGFFGYVIRGFFSIPAISILGGMCYSLYLTHAVVLTAVEHLLLAHPIAAWPVPLQTVTIYLLCLSGVVAVGTIYFVLIERPCMNPQWPQQLAARLSRRRSRPVTE